MKKALILSMLFIVLSALRETGFYMKTPSGWPVPVYDFSKNPPTASSVQLGRQLFYDPALSADGKVSCASCHSPFSAFAHNDHALSHGIHDSIGTRNAPALFNLAWRNSFMWDGAIHHLDMQALAPISHPAEMGSDLKTVVDKLSRSNTYRGRFNDAFGDSMVTGERTLKAIAQFLVTLVSCNSKYDSVQAGTTAFNEQELSGYSLFKANCNSCHAEPLFMSNEFTSNGISATADAGRSKVTGNIHDSLRFQIPSLRNLSFTQPYMHDGRFKRLQDVINHYSSVNSNSTPEDPRMRTIQTMDQKQKIDLLAFLLTLNDRHFIFQSDHLDPYSYSSIDTK